MTNELLWLWNLYFLALSNEEFCYNQASTCDSCKYK